MRVYASTPCSDKSRKDPGSLGRIVWRNTITWPGSVTPEASRMWPSVRSPTGDGGLPMAFNLASTPFHHLRRTRWIVGYPEPGRLAKAVASHRRLSVLRPPRQSSMTGTSWTAPRRSLPRGQSGCPVARLHWRRAPYPASRRESREAGPPRGGSGTSVSGRAETMVVVVRNSDTAAAGVGPWPLDSWRLA